jgi:thioredoxin-dependent peroxiredoxin
MERLKIGTKAPDFQGIDENGINRKLEDYRGKKLILFFYPKDNTPTCTAEACSLRDSYTELREKGFELLGISADDSLRHQKFKEKYRLPFPLIADTERVILEQYQVWGMKKFMGRVYDGIHRTTYVIDEQGIIERVFEKVISSNHADQILASYHNKS